MKNKYLYFKILYKLFEKNILILILLISILDHIYLLIWSIYYKYLYTFELYSN